MSHKELQTDILIIGGGVTGLNAAISARQAGADVAIMDKVVIERSGHTAGGIDHFLAYLNTGPEWDTREAYLEFTLSSARGATDLNVVDSVYCEELPTALQRFGEIGCPLRQSDGNYFRTRSYGQPGPWWINFNGKRMKPLLAQAVRKAGAVVLDRVVAGDLLLQDGRVVGAAGFHIRTGEYMVVSSKAVIVATGGTNRLFTNPSGLSFNTWMCPADTGDGEAIAVRAGAQLANVEYLRMTITPRFFSAAGLNALVGMGARLVNGKGEDFMLNYHPMGIKGPRYKIVEGVIAETKAHRGPIYMDCRHLEPNALQHLVTTLSYDKDTFQDYFLQKGIDLRHDLMEVGTSDGLQGGPNEVCGSGIKIDPQSSTTVPGLFAGGNSADQCRSLHMAVTSGIHAGRMAADYAAAMAGSPVTPPQKQVQVIKERLFAPLREDRHIDWREFEDVLQRILTEGMGPVRSAWGMEKACRNLDQLDSYRDQVKARSYHDLLRTQEVFNMTTVARCMLSAAMFRQESRFGQSHCRLDFPQSNDEKWLGQVVITLVDGHSVPQFVRLTG